MDEKLLQYVWQHRLYGDTPLQTADGQPVEVIYQGDLNRNAGPDFFNARLRIGDTLWAGNVEVHTRSDEWFSHGHHRDSAYNNVVLHVVAQHGKAAVAQNGATVAACCIPVPQHLQDGYEAFLSYGSEYPCSASLHTVSQFDIRLWMHKLIADRLEMRYLHVQELLAQTSNNWETVYYILIAQAFGGSVNKTAFAVLAQNLPLQVITKHKRDIFQLEALLFGTANLLVAGTDEYSDRLLAEYRFLSKKYSLSPIPAGIWRFARMRPANSPYIRIAQLAMLLHNSSKLFSRTVDGASADTVRSFFHAQASAYWDTHYSFSTLSAPVPKRTGEQFADSIAINAAVPILFSYGAYIQNETVQEMAISLLESLPPEQNSTVAQWSDFGIKAASASDSQAILQLVTHFCSAKYCLRCAIGNKLVREHGIRSLHLA